MTIHRNKLMEGTLSAKRLFHEMVNAAQSLDWHPNHDPRIHHSNARDVDWEQDRDAEREDEQNVATRDRIEVR